MTENPHPLSESRAAELWDGVPRSVVAFEWEDMNAEEMGHALTAMRAAYDAGREHEREHTDPHHDPRPWQDCTVGDIRKGDLVEALDKDGLRIGVAHHQNTFGDWFTEANYLLTYDDEWPLRRIPAPTPPAEEVELPTKAGTVIEAAEGHEFIEADVSGRKYYAREAMLSDAAWYGAWRTAEGRWANSLFSELITPGTWTTETLKEDA